MANVAFIQNLCFEYLGIMYLSSALRKAGHRTEAFIEYGRGLEQLSRALRRFDPDLIAFPCITGSHQWVISAAKYLKRQCPRARVILGGPHPTFYPDIIREEGVDIICRGEGENAIVDLADAIDCKADYCHISNLWVKHQDNTVCKNDVRHLTEDLDSIAFPDRSLYEQKHPFVRKSQKVFLTGRGCPFACTYCFNHAYNSLYAGKGTCVRLRSAGNVIREIRQVCASGRVRIVYLQDDTFGLNRKWAVDFLERYKQEVRLPFICLLRADLVDETLVRSLKAAGCVRAFFGVETGSELVRTLVLKKSVTDRQIIYTGELLHSYGIRFRTYNMFGLPDETLEDALQTVRLNIALKTDYPWSSIFKPYPGTELAAYAQRQGLWRSAGPGDEEASFFKHSALLLKDKGAIENLHRLFFYVVRFPVLLPVIRRLIHARLDRLYEFLFLAGYLISFYGSEGVTFAETLRIAAYNIRNFVFKKKNQ